MKPARYRIPSITLRALLSTLLALSILPGAVMAQTASIEGTWSGELDIQGAKLPLVFNVRLTDGVAETTMDSPAQGARGIPVAAARIDSGTLIFEVPVLGGGFEGILSADGGKAVGTWKQGQAGLPLTLEKKAAPVAVSRPQEPQPPFPYEVRDVAFAGGAAGVTLSGTLCMPPRKSGESVPAVVLVTGSGPQDRNETIFGHKPFLVIADSLARRGIASLRWDDRGSGASGGDFVSSTTFDFTDDALAALGWLAGQPGIDPGRLGLIGHSEGGLIGPIAAASDARIRFLVLLAGPGIRGDRLLLSQNAAILRASGTPEATIIQLNKINFNLYDIVLTSGLEDGPLAAALKAAYVDAVRNAAAIPESDRESAVADAASAIASLMAPWFRTFLSIDPADWLSGTTIPVLALNGARDLQVPWEENLAAIDAALPPARSPYSRTQPLEGLNHLFQTSESGLPAEYGLISETFSPVALDIIGSWILSLPR